ncbi:MAG: TerB family tellurite resistance protein [Pseudomonadota bacterium]
MNLDTVTIQRLRNALLDEGRAPDDDDVEVHDTEEQHRAFLEKFTPFAQTMFLVAMADGDEDPAEIDALRGAMRILTENRIPDTELLDILDNCRESVRQSSIEACLYGIGTQLCADRLDRETAFTLAAAVALADGKVTMSESDILQFVAENYGISSRVATRLLDGV